MSHVPAPESTPEASAPESGHVSDRDAQHAREARYVEAIEDGLFRMHGITSSCDHREEARDVIEVADVELAPLVARVAELEAEVAWMHSWDGLLSLLDEHWPEDIFPTTQDDETRDTGPRLVAALRRADRAEAALARVTARTDEEA